MAEDEVEAVKQLLDVLDDVKVAGPDHEGLVWITCTPSDGDAVCVNMGKAGSLTGHAALLWREETAAMSPEMTS